ncbi:hypothetical protein BE20_06355 [Sorangium cellulosum]|uniref:Uncharacterized protein n=1 Tax=Sorangium cellulosum TaxID=56 RepID=A0A150RAT4_SORCE|nr:hypothetical protein BE18_39490 [Sorangium cellulosum]KYF94548.1 hypothetical protein BE20_06355 [Sorangium cellulosum]
MTVLLQNDYLTVTLDQERSIVRSTRSEHPYASPDEFIRIHTEALQVYESLDRSSLGHLIDLRRPPMNNEPSFEAATMRTRSMLVQEFAAVVIVVRTAVGALQVNRLLREENNDSVVVLHDEDVALGYLVEELRKVVRRSSTPPGGRDRSSRPSARPLRVR